MSRYSAGKTKINEEILKDLEENLTHESVFNKIDELGFISEWDVAYGYDHVCMYFMQFKKVTIDDFERPEYIEVDYLSDNLNGKEIGYLLKRLFGYDIMRESHADLANVDCGF